MKSAMANNVVVLLGLYLTSASGSHARSILQGGAATPSSAAAPQVESLIQDGVSTGNAPETAQGFALVKTTEAAQQFARATAAQVVSPVQAQESTPADPYARGFALAAAVDLNAAALIIAQVAVQGGKTLMAFSQGAARAFAIGDGISNAWVGAMVQAVANYGCTLVLPALTAAENEVQAEGSGAAFASGIASAPTVQQCLASGKAAAAPATTPPGGSGPAPAAATTGTGGPGTGMPDMQQGGLQANPGETGTGGSGTGMPATQQGGLQANPGGATPTTSTQNQPETTAPGTVTPKPVMPATAPGTVGPQPAMPAADQSTTSQQIAQPMVAPGVSGRKMLTAAWKLMVG